jgi:dipeptidyl aminopeptidase/acylaminoacyl peptidase
LHDRLQNVYLGTNSYSFVMSPKGTFIYHPNPLYEFPAALSSLDRIKAATMVQHGANDTNVPVIELAYAVSEFGG